MRIMILLVGLISLAACGTVNNALVEKRKTVEYYRIFDIKTKADREAVIEAASNGLGKNVNDAAEAKPIYIEEIPDKPGRFKLVNPFKNSALGALASSGGSLGFQVATCDGSVWNARAVRKISGSNQLILTACLFPYKEGYNLDLYATFTKLEGGLRQISRSMANAMVGTPEEWTEKTCLDIVRTINERTHAEIKYLEGYPKLSGTPWLDTGKELESLSTRQ